MRSTAPVPADRIDRWRDVALYQPGLRRDWAVRRIVYAKGPLSARALAEITLRATDDDLRDRVLTAIGALTDPAAVDAVCEVAIESGDERLQAVLVEAGHEPSAPGRRALWLLLTGQPDRYAALDFDGALLRATYRDADVGLRRRIAERARAAGRVEWVRVSATDPHVARRLDEEQWGAALRVLVDTRRFDALWRLLPHAPLRWAARILVALTAGGWRPADEADRAAFDALATRARACRTPLSAHAAFDGPAMLAPTVPIAVGPEADLMVTSVGHGVMLEGLSPLRRVGTITNFAVGEPASAAVAFSPDGGLLALGGSSGTVAPVRTGVGLWSVPELTPVAFLTMPPCCRAASLAVTPDRVVVFLRRCWGGRHGNRVTAWDPDRPPAGGVHALGAPVRIPDDQDVDLLATTPDGRTLATVSRARSAQRGELCLWDRTSGRRIAVLDDSSTARTITVSTDGRLLFTSGGGNRLWRLPTGAPVGSLEPTGGRPASFGVLMSPDGRFLVGPSRIWRSSDLEPIGDLSPSAHTLREKSVVSPDGSLLLGGLTRPAIGVWHLPDGTGTGTLRAVGEGAHWKTYRGLRPEGLFVTSGNVVVTSYRKPDGRHRAITTMVWWSPRPVLVGSVPVGTVDPPDVQALRTALAGCPSSDRAWPDLLEALVLWLRRHDVAVSATEPGAGPGATDIEVDR